MLVILLIPNLLVRNIRKRVYRNYYNAFVFIILNIIIYAFMYINILRIFRYKKSFGHY